jgi:hypothetical protein
MEAHADTFRISTRSTTAPRRHRLKLYMSAARARRRERAIHTRGVRVGSPPGPADRMLVLPPKAY